MHSAELERLDFRRVAKRTNAAVAVVWIALWLSIAAATRATTGEWYGLAWGFILGGAMSTIGTWLFYVRPVQRRRIAATLTWDGAAITIVDGSGAAVARIALDAPHRTVLIRSKGEGRALLRIEQLKETETPSPAGPGRLDLFGPLPPVLPMRVAGEAHSLRELERSVRQRGADTGKAYRFGAPEAAASEQMTALMAFIEAHKAHRNDQIVVRIEGGVLRLSADKVALEIGGEALTFDAADEPALRLAVETVARAVPLHDESIESLVVIHALRRVLLRRLPEHPLLETLRR